MRVSPETFKENGLVLDFGGNTKRLGPINDPVIPRTKGKATGDAPVKTCEACGAYNHPSYRFCEMCGAEFEFKVKFMATASDAPVMRDDKVPVIEWFDIENVYYYKFLSKKSKDGIPQLRVDYYTPFSLARFTEFISLENPKAAYHNDKFWQQRHKSPTPTKVDDALKFVQELRPPRRVRVWTNAPKYPKILSVEW